MHVSSLVEFFVEASSFVCFLLVILLPILYVARSFFAETKLEKAKSKKAVQNHYIEAKLQEQLSSLESRVNQKFLESDDKMQHQNNTEQSRIEDLQEKIKVLEATFKEETYAQKLILDSKSLLLELALQNRDIRMDSSEKIRPLDQTKILSAAVQSIAETTKIFSGLLPRVLALEMIAQSTRQEAEQQIRGLSQKVDQINEAVQQVVRDQYLLNSSVNFNCTALNTKIGEMEKGINDRLANCDQEIATKTLKSRQELADVRKAMVDVGTCLALLIEQLNDYAEEESTRSASYGNDDTVSSQIVLYRKNASYH
ncbi:hypothetical protein MBANPS3_002821 [Mucor bainieri]